MRVLIYLPLAIYRAGDRLILIDAYFVGEEGTTTGLILPQSELTNLAVNVLSIAMFTGVPRAVPVTVVWLVPLKCPASGN